MMVLTLLLRLDFLPGGNHHHKKGMNAPSALGEEACLTPEKLDGLNLVGIAPTLASSVGSERTKDVNTLQKSIVNYGWEDYFIQPNEGTTFTRVSKKMRSNKKSHLLDALQRKSRMLETLRASLGLLATTSMLE
ncbi:hypothetical protein AAG906_012062 [Vitis piasezkii]